MKTQLSRVRAFLLTLSLDLYARCLRPPCYLRAYLRLLPLGAAPPVFSAFVFFTLVCQNLGIYISVFFERIRLLLTAFLEAARSTSNIYFHLLLSIVLFFLVVLFVYLRSKFGVVIFAQCFYDSL